MNEKGNPRILAVEDNPDTQLLLRYLLRPHYELEIVPHVDDALEAARNGQFDLLVLDINLGEERTGIDLLVELRQMAKYSTTPALALTAYAMPGDRERFQQSGFDEYISKPFTRKELYEALQSMLEESRDA
jgi:CheY-like chemotaxis protein